MRKELMVVSVLIFAGFLVTGYGWAQTKSGSDAGTSSDTSKSTSKMKSDKSSTSDMGSSGSSMDMSKSASGAGRSAGSENVKKVQEALKAKGQDPGPIDGRMGPKTKAAIKAYQSANNLKATGTMDSETAKSLGVESASSSAAPSSSKSSKSNSSDTGMDKSGPSGSTGTSSSKSTSSNTSSDKSGSSSSFSDLPSGRNAPSSRDRAPK